MGGKRGIVFGRHGDINDINNTVCPNFVYILFLISLIRDLLGRVRDFPIVKKWAREPASFWREKRESRRHFSTSFCENGVMAKTSYRRVSSFIIF